MTIPSLKLNEQTGLNPRCMYPIDEIVRWGELYEPFYRTIYCMKIWNMELIEINLKSIYIHTCGCKSINSLSHIIYNIYI